MASISFSSGHPSPLFLNGSHFKLKTIGGFSKVTPRVTKGSPEGKACTYLSENVPLKKEPREGSLGAHPQMNNTDIDTRVLCVCVQVSGAIHFVCVLLLLFCLSVCSEVKPGMWQAGWADEAAGSRICRLLFLSLRCHTQFC